MRFEFAINNKETAPCSPSDRGKVILRHSLSPLLLGAARARDSSRHPLPPPPPPHTPRILRSKTAATFCFFPGKQMKAPA